MLEVEAAGDTIDIEQLPNEMQAGHLTAFHRGQVHFTQGYATGGDELLAEGSPPGHGVAAGAQGGDQGPLLASWPIGPAQLRIGALLIEQMQPEATAELWPGSGVAELAAGLLLPAEGEQLLQLGLGATATPVEPQRCAIAAVVQRPRREGREPQGGRTAQAPVGDQHRPLLPEAARQACRVRSTPR